MNKKFEAVQVAIESLHPDGYGTTSDPKFCVHGSLPGEEVVAMPFTRRKRKIFARTSEILNPSADRVEPPCSAAAYCGGCSLQHLHPTRQNEIKNQQLKDVFFDLQPEQWFSPLTGDVGGYRSKARLGVKYVEKKEKVMVGFREKMKPFIAETESCYVLRQPLGNLLQALAALISTLSVRRQIPQIEVAVGDTETALVFRHLEALTDEDRELLINFAEMNELSVYLQPGDVESVTKLWPADDYARLQYSLPEFDLTYSFHPMDFTQINHSINRQMVSRAVELLAPTKDDKILDGFCGIGNFSLPIARFAGEVLGVEGSVQSIQRAIENAELNGINNGVFIAQDLFAESLDIAGLQDVNKVLLDPPRSGAEALCKKLASDQVERLVYVSCNPVTLARDAKLLVANGFQFKGAGVIDMFPHTTHVESIAYFSN